MSDKDSNKSFFQETTEFIKSSALFIWLEFELFIRRSILPSSVFFILLFLADYNCNQSFLFNFAKGIFNLDSSILIIFILLLVVLSVNYILKFLGQLIFDNFIKLDYNFTFPIFPYQRKEQEAFENLRAKVVAKLNKEYRNLFNDFSSNDYILYQILGKILSKELNKEYAVDTRRYTTDAKEAGVIIVSIIVVLIFCAYFNRDYWWLYILISLFWWIIGFSYIKAKYRSRAYRLYINYLLME